MATVDFVQDYFSLVVKKRQPLWGQEWHNKAQWSWISTVISLSAKDTFLCSGPQAVLALTHAASRASLISRAEWMAGKPPFSFACLQIAAKAVWDIKGILYLRLAMFFVFFFSPSICCNKVESSSLARAIFARGASSSLKLWSLLVLVILHGRLVNTCALYPTHVHYLYLPGEDSVICEPKCEPSYDTW